MTEKPSVLYSEYIIDGMPRALTPARMLEECSSGPAGHAPARKPEPIIDETLDLAPSTYKFDPARIDAYLGKTCARAGEERGCPVHFAGSHTCGRIARALIDALWMTGHFRLGDLTLRAEWRWDAAPIGNMAAFYDSVEAAAAYIDALGLRLKGYAVTKGPCQITFKASTTAEEEVPDDEEEDFFRELPFRTEHPRIGRKRKCPAVLQAEASDWLIYIPFDSCEFRLGGSVLSEAEDARSALAPDIADADYFIDCYEVVRELVEDGVVKAGATVCDGGMLTALKLMAADGTGADISVSDIVKAYNEKPVRVLFAEVPGVILQIADIDYDYVDAELLLQDVVYFPLGHPVPGNADLRVAHEEKTGLSSILESLLYTQTSEGED